MVFIEAFPTFIVSNIAFLLDAYILLLVVNVFYLA